MRVWITVLGTRCYLGRLVLTVMGLVLLVLGLLRTAQLELLDFSSTTQFAKYALPAMKETQPLATESLQEP